LCAALFSVEIRTPGWPRQQERRRPEEIVADDSDAVFITPAGVQRGVHQAPRRGAPAAGDIKTTIDEGDILFLEWGAEGGGLIRVQTVRYILQPAR
jgi:hypothetical protein